MMQIFQILFVLIKFTRRDQTCEDMFIVFMHTFRIFARDLQFVPIHFLVLLIYVLPRMNNGKWFTSNLMQKKQIGRLIKQNSCKERKRKRIIWIHTNASSYASAASARSSARSKSTSMIAIRRATCTQLDRKKNRSLK